MFVVPPLNALGAAVIGFFFRRRRAGRVVLGAGLAVLWLTSLPVVADSLIYSLESPPPPVTGEAPQAIVVLGGDATSVLRDGVYHTDLGVLSLARVRAGAQVARRTHLPVLITGGSLGRGEPAIAQVMAESLQQDFGQSAPWVEQNSRDTWENAALSAPILHRKGIDRVYVVTHAWHMRRALVAFRAAHLTAVAAPVELDAPADFGELGDYLPHCGAWQRSFYALHEWIGCAWYALRAG